MSKTVLITGAAGFIGSQLADALLARGDTIVALDNFNDYYDPAIKRANIAAAQANPRYALHEFDIGDCDAVFELFRATHPDVVVHLAARAGVRPSIEHPRRYYDVNIRASENILDAMRETKPSHLVFASSSSVYGGNTKVPFSESDPVDTPISIYAATKRMNELQAHVHHKLYGLRVSMMRFFTVYGPRQRPDMAIHKFTELMLAGKPIPMFGDGTTRRDYTYIDDIVHGLIQTVDRPFDYEIFNLGEHHTTSLRELINLLAEVLGISPIIEQHPLQPGDVEITYADISKAKALLDYHPTTPMREGLTQYAQWRKSL